MVISHKVGMGPLFLPVINRWMLSLGLVSTQCCSSVRTAIGGFHFTKIKVLSHLRLLTLFLILLTGESINAQWKNPTWIEYIRTYKDIAMEQQDRYKIPASITLAQGILESAAGTGRLARIANNHFGIKCHNWKGPYVRHDDDLRQECFRKYKSAVESYEDHSIFLTTRAHYAPLFRLNIRDYKGWAFGLSRAGYATDKSYPNKLITIIENYELYEYDVPGRIKSESGRLHVNQKGFPQQSFNVDPHQVFRANNMLYVVARAGDDLRMIARELGFNPKKLASYNEIGLDFPLSKGDIIYLQKKKKKAPAPYFRHIVEDGDSMHSIAQQYGMRLASLYKLNKLPNDYMPEAGNVLRLR